MKQQLINGKWCDALNGKAWQVQNPATEEIICSVPFGDDANCNLAIEAAAKAFTSWSSLSSWVRAEILKKTADVIRGNIADFARETILESGKPKAEAEGDWQS